jgi:hypothetical protein
LVDIRSAPHQNAPVTDLTSTDFAPRTRRPTARRPRHLPTWLLVGAALLAAGCADVRERLQARNQEPSDPRWVADSSLLAGDATILFRLVQSNVGPTAVPVFTIGPNGIRLLRMGDRGWRALDLQRMASGNTLYANRFGRTAGTAEFVRGMWEQAQPLDSLPGCPTLIPAGLMRLGVSDGVQLLTTRPLPPLRYDARLSPAELEQAIAPVPTLVAPTLGVSPGTIGRYRREVHQVVSGSGPAPTIVITYDDPDQVPDSIGPIGQRPRHLTVILDKGLYGYRTSYTYATVGNAKSPPRLRFIDYLDVDGDGLAELFFGVQLAKFPLYTVVMRFESERWREVLRNPRGRCDVM